MPLIDLLAEEKKTVWAAGNDKPVILDYERFLQSFAYILLNPLKDKLVPNMSRYKGVCSWKLFMEDQQTRECRIINRSSIGPLKNPFQPWKEATGYLTKLLNKNKKEGEVIFNFYAWKKCFYETRNLPDSEIRLMMLKALTDIQTALEEDLKAKSFYPDLSRQSLLKTYSPKKFGRKMICLAKDRVLRVNFIRFFKNKVAEAREVYLRWKIGDLLVRYPVGMFAPNCPWLANLIPSMAPL